MEAKLPQAEPHLRLPRLTAAYYRGFSTVHWSMTLENRAIGWLDNAHHGVLRELLLHTCHRYGLVCPAYCLMPDHAHFLWQGVAADSDQNLAVAWFRRQWSALLSPHFTLQRQGHDHVLRNEERERNAFAAVAGYILQNPQRAGLVAVWQDWPHLGAIFPGAYPLDPRAADYWARLWREHTRRVARPTP
jgi:REP element-mobilizing transposase RayT